LKKKWNKLSTESLASQTSRLGVKPAGWHDGDRGNECVPSIERRRVVPNPTQGGSKFVRGEWLAIEVNC